MKLMPKIFQSPYSRVLFAVVMVCALLVTQFNLNRHVIEHAASPTVSLTKTNELVGTSDTSSCLTCLEHQAHSSSLICTAIVFAAEPIKSFELHEVPPNTPYLALERARQRAPPILS